MKIILILVLIFSTSNAVGQKSTQQEWFNFKSQKFDLISIDESTPDKVVQDYIPQDEASQGMFRSYIALGNSPLKAMTEVLLFHMELYKSQRKEDDKGSELDGLSI